LDIAVLSAHSVVTFYCCDRAAKFSRKGPTGHQHFGVR